jgi:RNA polymerase sigma-70 factor (ECF subfamily)
MNGVVTDEDLVRRLQSGEEHALTELMRRYSAKLVRYGRRFLSSDDSIGDVVQDVFIAVYENINDFDATRRFSPWVYRIAHNAFVDVLRRRSKEPLSLEQLELDRIIPHPIYEALEESEKEKEEMRVLVERELRALTGAQREVLDLYYFEDFSYQEIADILHIPIGTVGIRLSRAKQALRKRMSQNYE